jgi:Xaa-Pro aminopeptidase
VRRDKLVRKIKQAEVDSLLVTNFTNVRYLTGFSGDDSYLLIGRDVCLIISDSRYTTQLREECPGLELSIRKPGKLMTDAVAGVLRRVKPAKLGFESTSTTVAQWQTLTEKVKSLELVPIAGLVEELRAIKDRHEIAAIREAIRQANRDTRNGPRRRQGMPRSDNARSISNIRCEASGRMARVFPPLSPPGLVPPCPTPDRPKRRFPAVILRLSTGVQRTNRATRVT